MPFYTWPALAGIALVLIGNLPWGTLRNVLPLTGVGLLPATLEAVPNASHFGELVYLVVFSKFLVRPGGLMRATGLVAGISAASFALVLLLYLMVLPYPGGLNVPFPLFEMTRLVQGGRFLERLDAVWLIFWVLGTCIQTALALMATSMLIKDAFRLPDHRGAVMPLATSMLAVALFPSNQNEVITTEAFFLRRWGVLVTLVLPLLVTVLARVRRRDANA